MRSKAGCWVDNCARRRMHLGQLFLAVAVGAAAVVGCTNAESSPRPVAPTIHGHGVRGEFGVLAGQVVTTVGESSRVVRLSIRSAGEVGYGALS